MIALHSRDFFRPYIVATAWRAHVRHDRRFIPWPVHNDNPIPLRTHTRERDAAHEAVLRSTSPEGRLTPRSNGSGSPAIPFDDVSSENAKCGRAASAGSLLHSTEIVGG